jgi:hypothetical protein
MSAQDELKEAKEALKKVENEMKELKNELEKIKGGNRLKQFALDFNMEHYMKLNYIDSAKWIAEVVSQKMKDKMKEKSQHFSTINWIKGCFAIGARTCSKYNRGEMCSNGKWHVQKRPFRKGHRSSVGMASGYQSNVCAKEELRLHCCILCYEAMEIIVGHPVVKCPWIMEKTWKELDQKEK